MASSSSQSGNNGGDGGDVEYFESYFDFSVHELMLKDAPRNDAYNRALSLNPSDLRDKVVLDVGAGSGILSLFAARAGAKKVYAVEASAMAQYTKLVVEQNGFQDKITVINDMVEAVELPEKVDVIISEWMGCYLLHESMFKSVMFARDRWLKQDGRMFPTRARLYVSPVSMDSMYASKASFWDNVCGFNLGVMGSPAWEHLTFTPQIVDVTSDQVMAPAALVREWDLETVTEDELCRFRDILAFKTNKPGLVRGFSIWWDVSFTGKDQTVILDTAPSAPSTHWKQAVILLPKALEVGVDTELQCKFMMSTAPSNPRHYNISLELIDNGGETTFDEDDDAAFYGGDGHGEIEILDESEIDEEMFDGHEDGCECVKCALVRACLQQYG
eukprot:TRINITY_DN2465_c0_g2_i1.p1 TRINITY_DN2465_c0_g2~~TRINITY_DN2465_c0_g2_i1.p1  ORF type:complete len:387 (+),score=104.44 TRINITY_DN2465_c0_g2_i1:24-1184(+)